MANRLKILEWFYSHETQSMALLNITSYSHYYFQPTILIFFRILKIARSFVSLIGTRLPIRVQWSRPMIIFAYISNDMYKCTENWQVAVTPAKKTLSPPRPRSTSLRPRKCYWEQRVGILRGIDIAAFAILPADVHIYTLLSDCIGKYMCLCSPFLC